MQGERGTFHTADVLFNASWRRKGRIREIEHNQAAHLAHLPHLLVSGSMVPFDHAPNLSERVGGLHAFVHVVANRAGFGQATSSVSGKPTKRSSAEGRKSRPRETDTRAKGMCEAITYFVAQASSTHW